MALVLPLYERAVYMELFAEFVSSGLTAHKHSISLIIAYYELLRHY